jgi:uncharacterized protein (TIGR00730 family)
MSPLSTSISPSRNITVYCSSRKSVAQVYHEAATQLGAALAARGWGLVYGGNKLGLMARVAQAVRDRGGRVVGVTPQLFLDQGFGDDDCHELLVADSMRHRKAIMESRGHGFIAMPGGLGTLEEIFEIIVARTLRLHDKPIVLLNVAGFYDPLLAMLRQGIEQQFIRGKSLEAFHVASTVADAMAFLTESFAVSEANAAT